MNSDAERMVLRFSELILHGDEEHREWLRLAARAFVDGVAVPPPAGLGKVEVLEKALNAACGYLLNAKIDLETGCTKATAIRTIEGGLKMIRGTLAAPSPVGKGEA